MALDMEKNKADIDQIIVDMGHDANGWFVPFQGNLHQKYFFDVEGSEANDIVFFYKALATTLVVGDTKTWNGKTYYVVDSGRFDVGNATPFVKIALLSRYANPVAPEIQNIYYSDLYSGRVNIEFVSSDDRMISYYEVERSFDGSTWHTLGTTETGPFTDYAVPPLANLWYRVRSWDRYGRVSPWTSWTWLSAQWMRWSGNPILSAGAGWDAWGVSCPCIAYENDVYHLFYGGMTGATTGYQIGHATLTKSDWDNENYSNWVRDAGNPVLSPAGAGFMVNGVWEPYIFWDGSYWIMLFSGYDNHLGGGMDAAGIGAAYASTLNGPWTVVSNVVPLIGLGAGAEWDAGVVFCGSLFYEEGSYYCYFSGASSAAPSKYRIGRAQATDPLGTYTKYASNPILTSATGWESESVLWLRFLKCGTFLVGYYQGVNVSDIFQWGDLWAGGPTGALNKGAYNPSYQVSSGNESNLRIGGMHFRQPGTQKWFLVYGSADGPPATLAQINLARLWR